jgi:hypothetical protein
MRRVALQHPKTRSPQTRPAPHQEHPMLDVIMLTLGLALFAAAVGYSYACERL